MMLFQPYPTRSGFIFLSVAVVFGLMAIFLATLWPQQEDLFSIFRLLLSLLLVLAMTGLALYGALIAFKLHYHLNRNGVVIQWGVVQYLIPFESIKTIIPGKNLPAPKFKGVKLAGLQVGWGELAEYGPVKFHTTATVADSLLVVTAQQAYVISPRQPDSFIKAWQARQTLGPTQDWSAGVRRSWPLNVPLLADPFTWGLWGVAALVCLALFGYLSLRFPNLPRSLPIHFNALGHADRIADKSTLLLLPAAGAMALVFNAILGSLLYRREKVAAYLLWGSAIVIQLCLWMAVVTITGPK